MDVAQLDQIPNRRSAALAEAEMVENAEGGFNFEGLAAVYGEEADLGEFRESIVPGAFRRILATTPNVPLLLEHDPLALLATTGSGRMQLSEDARGLRVRASMVRTDLSERVRALVGSGDLRGMSIGFVVGSGNSRIEQRSGRVHRTILGFKKLLDCCVTHDPAYAGTTAEVRSAALAGAYLLPAEPEDPLLRRQLQLDEMEVRMQESDRRLKELGLV